MFGKSTPASLLVLVGGLTVTATSPARGQANNCCVLGEICEGTDINNQGNWCADSSAGQCATSSAACSSDFDCDPGVCTGASGDSCTVDTDCTRTFPDSPPGFVETCLPGGTCGIACHQSYESPAVVMKLGFNCPVPETCVGLERCILDDCPQSVCSDAPGGASCATDNDCTAGTCSGSAAPCHSDIDCAAGNCTSAPVGPCRHDDECPTPFITCTAPSPETCIGGATCDPHQCVGDQPLCQSTDQSTCETTIGGFWQSSGLDDCTPPGTPVGENVCFVGACCTDDPVPPACKDDATFNNQPGCAGFGGSSIFIPGATCAGDPCPVCEIEEQAKCQLFDVAQGFIVRCDLASGTTIPNWRCADDFVSLTTGSLNRICWWPAFAPVNAGDPECSQPGSAPADTFRIRIYPDLGHIPDEGAELGPPGGQPLNIDVKAPVLGRIWQYSAPLETPILLTASECYWLEITGSGTPACDVFWSTSNKGNQHAMEDFNFPDFGRYTSEDATNFDFAWCVNTGIVSASPTESGCGTVLGSCCACGTPGDPPTCQETSKDACAAVVGGTGFPGKWKIYRICETSGIKCQQDSDCDPGEACIAPPSGSQCDLAPGAVNPCGGEPGNDACANAFTVSHLNGDPANDINDVNNNPTGLPGENSVLTDIRCATTDGPATNCGTNPGDLSFDVWFNYVAPVCGTLTVQQCNSLPIYDGFGAVYRKGDFNPGNECAEINAGSKLEAACNDDGCGAGGPWNYQLDVAEGEELIIRVGAWFDGNPDNYARAVDEGSWELHLEPDVGQFCAAPVGDPLPAAFPHDRRKNRYISFDPNKAENDGTSVAFKVELTAITLGSCNGAAGDPSQVDFCRVGEVPSDCNTCAGATAENSCISQAIDCSTGGTCTPTGETCVNDAPNSGGSNVGTVWWVGPESPLNNDVHLLVSLPFRLESADWPNPVHVGDCEVVPEAVYQVTAVVAADETESAGSLSVETTLFAATSSSWWADCVGGLQKFCGGDIRTPVCVDDTDCTPPATCDLAWTLPDGTVNFDDANAALMLFAPGPTSVAPDVTWVDVAVQTPDYRVNMSDIGQILHAFSGFPYKYADPADCPSPQPECGNGTLESGEQCDDGDNTPGDGCGAFCQIEGTGTIALAWVPVDSDASPVFTSNGITILAGSSAIVELEVRPEGWGSAPGSPTLGIYQATLDASTLSGADPTNLLNGTSPGVDLTPLNNQAWRENPGGNGLNDGAFLATNTCHDLVAADTGLVCGSIPSITWDACPGGAPLCVNRDDFVFAGNLTIGAVSTATADFVWGGVTSAGQCTTDDGVTSYYAGTLVLNVPDTAIGTYTIGFDANPTNSFLSDCSLASIPGVGFIPATITLDFGDCLTPADCDDNNACTDDTCNAGTCGNVVNYNLATECCDPVSGSVVVIDNGDICTVDTCDPFTGLVSHDPTATTFPAVVHVKGDAFGANDGSSWHDAFTDLQTALRGAACMPGDVDDIWVAKGVYHPDRGGVQSTGDRSATFGLLNGVGLYGGFVGSESARDQRNPALFPTILSGDLAGDDLPRGCVNHSPDCDANGGLCVGGTCIIADNNGENSYSVVTGSGTDTTAILNGFTITAGNANGAGLDELGAGMHNGAGSPTVADCTFSGNTANANGGGMWNDAGAPTVLRCDFAGNSANEGGAVNNSSSTASFIGCVFHANSASNGGGMANGAGGVPTLTACVFVENSASGNGGGMFSNGGSNPELANCTFNGNRAAGGGGMLNDTGAPTLTNCIFSGNSASNGGGMRNDGSSIPELTQCSFASNTATGSGGGIFNSASGTNSPTLTNCILWGNSDAGGTDESAQMDTAGGTPVVNHSVVQGGWSGAGGIGIVNMNPSFVRDPDDGGDGWGVGDNDDFGNLRLQSGSPATDAGDNDALPLDTNDVDGDGNTGEVLPIDLDGLPRRLEDLLTVDTGNTGALGTPIVDLGAYEFLRDCDGNGIPDDQDMANCAGTPICADCNGNDIPDGCDIAECDTAVDLSCNDCDLNGVPDGCDDPVDNIPDSCVEAAASGNWTDDIWGLSGNFPDSMGGAPDKNVTLGNVDIFLDVDAEIPTLRILNGATFDATGFALTIGGNTAPFARAEGDPTEAIFGPGTTSTVGELTATTIQVFGNDPFRGTLSAKSDCGPPSVCNITAESLAVDGGGIYQQVGTGSTMQLTAGSVTLSGGSCGAAGGGNGVVGGGEINLFDGMTITTIKDLPAGKTGDFIINGSETAGCSGSLRGIIPPPKLGTGCSALRGLRTLPGLVIGGNFIVTGMARISISSTPCGLNRALLPDQIIQLQGDLINQSTAPDFFDWETGGITLNGLSPQRFEVAGEDIGALPEGFSSPGAVGSNFAMGTVEVAPGANVTFVDEFDNDGSGEDIGVEALYVRNLILGSGADVTFDRCHIYYEQLTNNGANVFEIAPGKLLPIGPAGAPLTAVYPHDRRKNRYISFDPNKAENDGENIAFKVALKQITLGSCDGNGGFCRADRGVDDCNACSIDGNPCISQPIDCSPGQTCAPTGETCVNDAPDTENSNVAQTWWVGPESPLANGVHLLVSGAFRKISDDWPNPTHVADCEIVPEAAYGIRAVNTDSTAESDELLVETTLFATASSSWWGDCVGPLKKVCGGDIRTLECIDDGDCTAPETCDRNWTLPDGSVNFDDVNAALALVAPGPTSIAPDPTWVDLHGNATGTAGSQNFDPPNFVLNFSDIGQILSGFGGLPYRGYDPADCPDSGTWP